MEEFMLLVKGYDYANVSPEVMEKRMNAYRPWMEKMTQAGRYKGGQPLEPGSGRDELLRLVAERKPAHLPNGPLPEFRKFYYEMAQGNTPGQIAALLKMVPMSQVLYGTDFPFRDGAEINAGIAAYGFNPDDIRSIEREVAFKLIPRLKQS